MKEMIHSGARGGLLVMHSIKRKSHLDLLCSTKDYIYSIRSREIINHELKEVLSEPSWGLYSIIRPPSNLLIHNSRSNQAGQIYFRSLSIAALPVKAGYQFTNISQEKNHQIQQQFREIDKKQ